MAFGELSVRRCEDVDVTASANGCVASERLVGKDKPRGLFVGATASRSDIEDDLTGNRSGFGLNAGAYFVDQLAENLFWDGLVTLGLGWNNLDLLNGMLDVYGTYSTTSVQVGLAVAGQRDYSRFSVFPELSLAYGGVRRQRRCHRGFDPCDNERCCAGRQHRFECHPLPARATRKVVADIPRGAEMYKRDRGDIGVVIELHGARIHF